MKLNGIESKLIFEALTQVDKKVIVKLTNSERKLAEAAIKNIKSNKVNVDENPKIKDEVQRLLDKLKPRNLDPESGSLGKGQLQKKINRLLNFLKIRTDSGTIFSEIKTVSKELDRVKTELKTIVEERNTNAKALKEIDFKLEYLNRIEARAEKEVSFNEKLYSYYNTLVIGTEKNFAKSIGSDITASKKLRRERVVEHEVKYAKLLAGYESMQSKTRLGLDYFYDIFTDEKYSSVKSFCDKLPLNPGRALLAIEKKIREYEPLDDAKKTGTPEHYVLSFLHAMKEPLQVYVKELTDGRKLCESEKTKYNKLLSEIRDEIKGLEAEKKSVEVSGSKLDRNVSNVIVQHVN